MENKATSSQSRTITQQSRHEQKAYCSRWRMRRPAAGECTCCEIMAGLASQGRGLYPSSIATNSCSLYLGWNRASLHQQPSIHSLHLQLQISVKPARPFDQPGEEECQHLMAENHGEQTDRWKHKGLTATVLQRSCCYRA